MTATTQTPTTIDPVGLLIRVEPRLGEFFPRSELPILCDQRDHSEPVSKFAWRLLTAGRLARVEERIEP